MGLVGSSSFLYLNVDVMVWDGHIISAFAKSSSFPHRQCYLFFFFPTLDVSWFLSSVQEASLDK